MPADEFFHRADADVGDAGDCVCAVRFPVWPHRRVGTGFHEVSARQSDFRLRGGRGQVAIDEDGRCLDVTLGLAVSATAR